MAQKRWKDMATHKPDDSQQAWLRRVGGTEVVKGQWNDSTSTWSILTDDPPNDLPWWFVSQWRDI